MEEEIITDQTKALLREKQEELIRLIEALLTLDKSQEWATVKELVFDKSLAAIERQLLVETLAPTVVVEKLYHLQGQWAWAKQYADVNRYVKTLKVQLENIKNKLK